jgi:drug/metabolite transporter (DMT)-like permease
MHLSRRHPLLRRAAVAHWRLSRLPPTIRGMLWSASAGAIFVLLNALMRQLSLELNAFQTQFLRYLMGLLVLLPLFWRSGLASLWPVSPGGQFLRGAVHTLGLLVWFAAVPHITLADTTVIGFTTPIFIMLGAALFLAEPMRWSRWIAAGLGLTGVLVVVGPRLTGEGGVYLLIMLCSAPLYALSFLLTKALTRYERPAVIVLWQSITVTLLSLPLALADWQWPTAWQWGAFLVCGILGSGGHYCLTRSYVAADISATQSIKFLELVWAAALGWVAFGDTLSAWTVVGGVVICASTVWIARREARTPA